MLINKSNYEFFAIDYVEGTLSAKELQAMRAFLQAHPNIEAELSSLKADLFTFEVDENVVYENKQSLLKKEAAIIVPMQSRTWYKIAAAAAIAILLVGFAAGYFSAYHFEQGDAVAAIETKPTTPDEKIGLDTNTSSKAVLAVEEEQLAKTTLPIQEEPKVIQNKRVPNKVQMPSLPLEQSALVMEETKETEQEQKTLPHSEIESYKEVVADITSTSDPLTSSVIILLPKKPLMTLKSEPLPSPNFDVQRMANLDRSKQFDFNRIKNFIGRLPFEDATLDAFVPTYLSGE